jgi:hypothetical protein
VPERFKHQSSDLLYVDSVIMGSVAHFIAPCLAGSGIRMYLQTVPYLLSYRSFLVAKEDD